MGIGSSAGVLAAFKDLLSHLPNGKDFVYVLVQHMDPSHPSMLVDILGKEMSIPVNLLVTAGESCQFLNGCLHLIKSEPEPGARHTVDYLFASIAEACAEQRKQH